MESPEICDKCPGYSICANHIKKGDHACAPFLRLVDKKLNSAEFPQINTVVHQLDYLVGLLKDFVGATPCPTEKPTFPEEAIV